MIIYMLSSQSDIHIIQTKVEVIMNIKNNISETVGNTPLMRLEQIEKYYGLNAKLYGKMEKFNPAGSIKDRVALALIDNAEKTGELSTGGTIIEPTSGNTGIGLAAIGVPRGYKVIITMPETMSKERQQLIKSLGAELILTDGKLGMAGAIKKAEELYEEYQPQSSDKNNNDESNKKTTNSGGCIIAGQFTNPVCVDVHRNTTGPEIWYDLDGRLDALVAGVGTGGTISGTGQYLKSKKKGINIVAVEPYGSSVLSGESAGPHKIQGIGAGFVPEILDTEIYDQISRVKDEDAFDAKDVFGRETGILIGISGGAAVWAAVELAKQKEYNDKSIVVILPDTGERYLSID